MAELIERTVKDHLKTFDIVSIADDISFDLDCLRAEEIWDRSGSTRHGYVDPDEVAVELFEEVISSHVSRMIDFQKRGLQKEAGRYCRGILRGIQKFNKEGKSDFKDWIGDGSLYVARYIFDTWRKGCTSKSVRAQTEQKVKQQWPGLIRL